MRKKLEVIKIMMIKKQTCDDMKCKIYSNMYIIPYIPR